MVEPVGSVQRHIGGWGQSMMSRHSTMAHRIAASAAAAVVMAPIIGVEIILAWLAGYLLTIGLERLIVSPDLDTDGRGPRGLKGVLCDAILFTSATTYAWIALPLWFAGGAFGGICALLYLSAGLVQSVVNGTGSPRITAVTVIPTATALIATPLFMLATGGGFHTPIAAATAVVVFIGICIFTARRLLLADRNLREAMSRARQARQQAEAARAAHTAFLHAMADDLRAPIAAIAHSSRALREAPLSPAPLKSIEDAGRRLDARLNDLLDQARIENGHLHIHEQAFDLRSLMARTLRLWRGPTRQRGARLSVRASGPLPRTVLGDPARLQQVLDILFAHVIRTLSGDRLTLHYRCWVDDAGDHALTVSLHSPAALSEAQRALLAAPASGGSVISCDVALGLGRDLMRLMNGRLTASHADGGGTLFHLALTLAPAGNLGPVPVPASERSATLATSALAQLLDTAPPPPRTEAPAPAPEPPKAEPQPAAPTPAPAPDEAPLRILVVDDHEINRRAIQLILQPFDCDVTMAADGLTALELADNTLFDVIFMDVRMPELDGRETTRRLRQGGGPNATTPVIAVTADNASEDRAACSAAGMNAYLAKPLTPATLIATLQATLEQGTSDTAASRAA